MEADDWLHVGDVHLRGLKGAEGQRQARELLAVKGLGDVRDEDLRLDLVCARNDDLDSWLRVHVRKTPSQPKPKKKPRRE